MSKKMTFASIFAPLATTLALGGNAQAAAPPPPPPSVPAATVAAKKPVKKSAPVVKRDAEFEIIAGFDSAKVIKTIEITKGQTDLHGQICPRKTIPIVANPTSDASEARQEFLNRVRRSNAMPQECETNDVGLCRSGLLQAGVNNSNGKIFCVLPDGFTTPADMKKLGDKVEQLSKDTDKDGIKDIDDKCVEIPAGPTPDPFMAGCPDKDTDKDGITDNHGDNCPNEPGPRENHGCPVKTVAPAAEPAPAPTPTADTVPVAAPAEAPKAATPATKIDDKKVFGMAAVKIGTDTTKTTVGSLNVSLLAGLCVTGTALQQNVKTDGGKTIVKPWFFCPTVSFGQATRWYPRGGEATHVAFGTDVAFLTGIRGLNASGSAYRDNMRTNGVFAGPSLWMLLTYASLFDQSFLANIGGGAGVQLKAVMGIATLGIGAGVGACRVAKPGYSPSLLAQPGAEICGKFDAYAGIAF